MSLLAQTENLQLLPDTAELIWGLAAFFVVLAILVAVSVHAAKDMNRRGQQGLLYGLLIFFAPPIGLVLWLVMRSRTTPAQKTSPSSAA